MLGNETPSGTNGNSRGYLRIYDGTKYYFQFQTRDSYTKNSFVVIPNASGTLGIINYGTSDPSSIDHGSIYLVYE